MFSDTLHETAAEFFTLLSRKHIKYVIVGGGALTHYICTRTTQDLDIIVAADALTNLSEVKLTVHEKNFARGKFKNLPIDFLLTSLPVYADVYQNETTFQTINGQIVPIATIEGIVLLKLCAIPELYQDGLFKKADVHEEDLAILIGQYQINTAVLLKRVSHYIPPPYLASVTRVVAEIETKLLLFGRGQQEPRNGT